MSFLIFSFVFVLFLLCFRTLWRRGACRSNYNTTSAGLSVLWVQHLSPRRLGGEPLPSPEKHTQLGQHQRIDNVSVCSYHYDTFTFETQLLPFK